MVFPVVMYGCESYTICKESFEHWIIDAFELWYWRRHLRVHWTARRSNQSILKEISPGCSLEGLMFKLKLILWPPDAQNWLIWKDPDAGKIEGWRKRDEMVDWHHQPDGHKFEQDPGVGDGQGSLECWNPWGHKESDMTERLNWTELNPLSVASFANIFSHSAVYLFMLSIVSFVVQKLLSFISFHLFIFVLFSLL